MEVMKGPAHGSISPTPSLAKRTLGRSYRQFIANLYMPEDLLRYRNKYERKVYPFEPARTPGTGDIEAFRSFVYALMRAGGQEFLKFHAAVSKNSKPAIRALLAEGTSRKMKRWLRLYLGQPEPRRRR